ncbi:MAG: nitrogen regulation protein NR(II) [Gammaproteobacteria bacterium]|nr:nitrogen regulation protein NR(II) [Gammaproteobacteria bacterium]
MSTHLSQQTLDSLSTAVLSLDADLRLRAINPAGEMLLDSSSRQIVGEHIESWLPNNPELIQALNDTLASQHPFTTRETMLRLPNGESITVDYTINPINEGHGVHNIVLELNQTDRVLRLAQEEKMLSQHMTNRAVIRGVAHEIKNPLGGIRGAAQLLERELPSEELKEYTRIIIEEADRLRNLIDRMFGPNQPLNREPCNIHELLQHVRKLVRVESGSKLIIRGDYDPSLPELSLDRDQMIQALLNLCRNAIEAMAGNGHLVLRSRIERQFTIGGERHRLAVRIDIEDSGPGIPEDIRNDIFYPLVTGRPDGTGLGLSITQDIVARHGGLVQVESRPGKTVFSIFLPLENPHGRQG